VSVQKAAPKAKADIYFGFGGAAEAALFPFVSRAKYLVAFPIIAG